jgi:hypothetical protein
MTHSKPTAERRRMVRWPVVPPIDGHVLALDHAVTLHDVSAGGFSVRASHNLTPGAAYEFRFALQPHPVVVTARLAHAKRMNPGQEPPSYLLGFEFDQARRDVAAITALMAHATRGAV